MALSATNIHGRKAGRGVRPWLLIPKVLAVGVYFGGLVVTTVIWFTGPRRAPDPTAPHVQAWIAQVSILFRFVLVPALLLAMLLGFVLFLQHPSVFARLRWWQVKVASVAIGVPAGHLFMASRFRLLKSASPSNWSAEFQLECGLVVLIAWTIWLIFLGRHKPRLWQNWARSFRTAKRRTPVAEEPHAPGPEPDRGPLILLALALSVSQAGCLGGKPDIALNDPNRPANLSLQFQVDGERAPVHPLRQNAMYVLGTDRRLRLAVGFEARAGFYPAVLRVISPHEYEAIVKHVFDRRLMAEPTSPRADAAQRDGRPPPVLYRVDLSGWSLVNRYVTTPSESPPTAALLEHLVRAARIDLPPVDR